MCSLHTSARFLTIRQNWRRRTFIVIKVNQSSRSSAKMPPCVLGLLYEPLERLVTFKLGPGSTGARRGEQWKTVQSSVCRARSTWQVYFTAAAVMVAVRSLFFSGDFSFLISTWNSRSDKVTLKYTFGVEGHGWCCNMLSAVTSEIWQYVRRGRGP